MPAALIVKDDGLIYVNEVPEQPTVGGKTYEGIADPGTYNAMKSDYERALASAKDSAILVSNHNEAFFILQDHYMPRGSKEFKLVPGIYPIPDLQWEVVDNTYIHEGSGKYWEDEPVKMKRLLDLPETYAILKESTPSEVKTAQEIIDQYPYLGSFLSSAQGNETMIKLMEEYASQFKPKKIKK